MRHSHEAHGEGEEWVTLQPAFPDKQNCTTPHIPQAKSSSKNYLSRIKFSIISPFSAQLLVSTQYGTKGGGGGGGGGRSFMYLCIHPLDAPLSSGVHWRIYHFYAFRPHFAFSVLVSLLGFVPFDDMPSLAHQIGLKNRRFVTVTLSTWFYQQIQSPNSNGFRLLRDAVEKNPIYVYDDSVITDIEILSKNGHVACDFNFYLMNIVEQSEYITYTYYYTVGTYVLSMSVTAIYCDIVLL